MDFNSIMKIFLPKDRVFFQLFEEVAEHVYEMGIKLKEMVNEPDADVRANILAQIENLEHKNDDLTHSIFTELGRNFITPFDREDIHALTTSIDDIADTFCKCIDMDKTERKKFIIKNDLLLDTEFNKKKIIESLLNIVTQKNLK